MSHETFRFAQLEALFAAALSGEEGEDGLLDSHTQSVMQAIARASPSTHHSRASLDAEIGLHYRTLQRSARRHALGEPVLRYLREAGEGDLANVLQYGWRKGTESQNRPGYYHWYGTDADKGQKRTQKTEPHSGRTKHKVDNVVASLKADIEKGKIEDSTLAVLKDMDRDQLSLLRHYLGLGERQQPGEKKAEFRERLEGKLREKAEEGEEGEEEANEGESRVHTQSDAEAEAASKLAVPMKLYHGTRGKYEGKPRPGWAQGWGVGVYLASDPTEPTSEFGFEGRVLEYYADLKKPLRTPSAEYDAILSDLNEANEAHRQELLARAEEGDDAAWDEAEALPVFDATEGTWTTKINNEIRRRGYDGVIAKNDAYGDEVVVFDPANLLTAEELVQKHGKSATSPDAPGFTGTDPQGREWRDGELVPAEESETSPLDQTSGAGTLPTSSRTATSTGGKTMPAVTTRIDVDTAHMDPTQSKTLGKWDTWANMVSAFWEDPKVVDKLDAAAPPKSRTEFGLASRAEELGRHRDPQKWREFLDEAEAAGVGGNLLDVTRKALDHFHPPASPPPAEAAPASAAAPAGASGFQGAPASGGKAIAHPKATDAVDRLTRLKAESFSPEMHKEGGPNYSLIQSKTAEIAAQVPASEVVKVARALNLRATTKEQLARAMEDAVRADADAFYGDVGAQNWGTLSEMHKRNLERMPDMLKEAHANLDAEYEKAAAPRPPKNPPAPPKTPAAPRTPSTPKTASATATAHAERVRAAASHISRPGSTREEAEQAIADLNLGALSRDDLQAIAKEVGGSVRRGTLATANRTDLVRAIEDIIFGAQELSGGVR